MLKDITDKVVQDTDYQYLVVINNHKNSYIMHDLIANFNKFHDITKSSLNDLLDDEGNLSNYRRKPTMSDSKVIALSICCESLGIDSENYLWSKLKSDYKHGFPDLCHLTNFNRRRKRLAGYIHELTQRIANKLNAGEDFYIVDSMPVPVCKLARERRSKICKENFETAPDKGYTASLEKWFYGYKLQLITSINGVFKTMEMTKASVHDVRYLDELKYDLSLRGITLIADRGYLSAPKQLELFEYSRIVVATPMRRGQRNYKTFPKVFKSKRKRIETLFSQLCDQMMLKRNYAKSFEGLTTRIICKIAAVTVLQHINNQNNRPLNQLKHALAA